MKRVLILGMGLSGKSALHYLQEKGFLVTPFDDKQDRQESIAIEAFDFVVVSPGISPKHPLYEAALKRGLPILGDVELALRESENRVIAITGTKGKSTTTALIAHVLNSVGKKARAVGNIGVPILQEIKHLTRDEIIVLEVSSFQLETIDTKRFDMALLLNLSPDHLDRYESLEEYYAVKRKISSLRKQGAPFFLHESIFVPGEDHICVKEDCHFLTKISPPLSYQKTACQFAYVVSQYLEIAQECFFDALKSFQGLRHRIEYIGAVRGIKCYNDSKATSPEAVIHAVHQLQKDIILLAGGKHKSLDFEKWIDVFPGKVKHLILFGDSKEFIARALQGKIEYRLANHLQDAVEIGLQLASKNDTLLLSPGCASFDQFLNFEERGDTFRRIIEYESKRHDFNCCFN